MQPVRLASVASTLVLGLLLLPTVLAHGDANDGQGHGHNGGDDQHDSNYPPTYFAHPEHVQVILAHIALMTIAWVVILPVAVIFSIAESRYTLTGQVVFLVTNALGLMLGGIYNTQTPDLYPNSAHHKVGWVVTTIVLAQFLLSVVGRVAGVVRGHTKSNSSARGKQQAFLPISSDARSADSYFAESYRLSYDSGHGSESNTDSLRSGSLSTADNAGARKEYDEDDFEDMPLSSPQPRGVLASKAAKFVSSRIWRYLIFGYNTADRIILPFGSVAFASGIIIYGRFFEGNAIFGGMAHWIKGGVFFWLGLFTLGRWSGSFAEIGWAWNVRPKRSNRWRPSSEFVESALICFYGCTNIFLEHLGSTDGKWTGQDLEHVSITVLFLGGGALGMLVESSRIRDLLNTTMYDGSSEHSYSDEERKLRKRPESYEFSLNPVPALVILLLGIMMSSHQQSTMISSMVHKQWGNLLTAASFARALTYVTVYLKPPTSVLPSRPPTELLTSFGLITGGIIFMASSSDTISGMIHCDLDAMFMYTTTMGLVGLVMAWEVLVLALKGWAVRKERHAASQR